MQDMIPVADLGQLVEGVPTPFQVLGIDVVLIRQGDRVTALQGLCPHLGSRLVDGRLVDGALTCPGHGWVFDCRSGECLSGSGPSLQVFVTATVGQSVHVAGDQVRAWQAGNVSPAPTSTPERTLHQLPGPKGLPLLGNLWQLRRLTRLHQDLEAWADSFGPIYRFSAGRRPVVVVADPSAIHTVLRDRPDGFRRLAAIAKVNRELGIGGVFSSEGDVWRRQRRRVAAGLEPAQVRRFLPHLNRIIERLRRRWLSCAVAGQPFDAQPDLVRLAVDVTTNFVFDADLNTLERGDDAFQKHLLRVLPTIGRRVNALFPYWRYLKLPADRAAEQAIRVLQATCRQFIARGRSRRGETAQDVPSPQSLLDTWLLDQAAESMSLTDDEIFGNAITMLLAGEDTTANTLAWLIHFLAHHPDVQQRVRLEAESVLRQEGWSEDGGTIDATPYLDGVVSEALRLKPPAPLLFLETCRSQGLAGIMLPTGTRLILLLRWPCLQSEHFTDPESFQPERWLLPRDSTRYPQHQRAVWLPFGAGPRFCPGRHLAWIEMKATIAMICRSFEVLPVETAGTAHEHFTFTMMPSHASVRLLARD